MKKEEWIKKITSQIKIDIDYIPSFETSILILAEILEERDRVYTEYIDSGAHPVIEFTSDRKAVNLKPNPLLKQWNELNTTALTYLRDLGITPAGLKKLQGQLPKQSAPDPLEQFKAKLELDDDDNQEVLSPDYWTKAREEIENDKRKEDSNNDG